MSFVFKQLKSLISHVIYLNFFKTLFQSQLFASVQRYAALWVIRYTMYCVCMRTRACVDEVCQNIIVCNLAMSALPRLLDCQSTITDITGTRQHCLVYLPFPEN